MTVILLLIALALTPSILDMNITNPADGSLVWSSKWNSTNNGPMPLGNATAANFGIFTAAALEDMTNGSSTSANNVDGNK